MWSYLWTRHGLTPCFDNSRPRLKLYDRVLDITPNDPDVMASKASIYQAQGNLQEAARLLIRNKRADSF